jgi:FKBP-type peptidyl-prolyl cis-trans isomerase 2
MKKKGQQLKPGKSPLKKEAKKIIAENQKKNKNDFRVVFILTAIFLIFFAIVFFYKGNFPAEKTAQMGDKVTITYIAMLENGNVFDSNIKDVIEKNGIETKTRYFPSKFKVGANQTISGLEEVVVGMRINEEKTTTVSPEKAFGQYQNNQTLLIPLSKEIPLFDKVTRDNIIHPKDLVDVFNLTTIKVNDTLPVSAKYKWPMLVIKVEDKDIMARVLPKVNDYFEEGSFNYTIVSVTQTEMVVKRKPLFNVMPSRFGQLILTETKSGINSRYNITKGIRVTLDDGLSYYIVGEQGNNILLDRNHPLAGKTLSFKINLTGIEELTSK